MNHSPLEDRAICKSLIAFLIHGNTKQKVRCFLDGGSQINLIVKQVCEQNKIKGPKRDLIIEGTQAIKTPTQSSQEVFIRLQNVNNSYTTRNFKAHTVPIITSPIQPILIEPKNYPHMKSITNWTEIYPMNDNSILETTLLIGEPLYSQLLIGGPILPPDHDPEIEENIYIQDTLLGAALCGSVFPEHCGVSLKKCRFTVQKNLDKLNENLSRFFDLEHMGISGDLNSEYTFEQTQAMELIKKLTSFDKKKKVWTTGLLFRNPDEPFTDNNRSRALAVMNKWAKKLSSDRHKVELMNAAVQKFHDEGFAEFVPASELNNENCFYLSIHPVFKEERSTTKVRMCVNAAEVTKQGSLNSRLIDGPNLLPEVCHCLLKYRLFFISCNFDLRNMFQRLSLRPSDADKLRFVYNFGEVANSSSKADFAKITRRFITVPFGILHAPYSAHYIVKENAKRFAKKYEEAYKLIDSCIYMDDFLCSFSSPLVAERRVKELYEIFNDGNFPSHKWLSNFPAILSPIHPSSRSQIDVDKKKHNTKILGASYNSITDELLFEFYPGKFIDPSDPSFEITKRSILSVSSSLYDPLGLVSAWVIIIKLLLQQLWLRPEIGWDNPVDDDLAQEYLRWYKQLPLLRDFSLPRALCPQGYQPLRVVTMADANEKSYCAISYLVSAKRNDDGSLSLYSIMMMSKTRVSPLRMSLTIPRLETLAALLCARLSNYVMKGLQLDIPVYHLSDSQIVLHRICRNKSPYKQWLQSRISEIHKRTSIDSWSWICSSWMSADYGTKGLPLDDLVSNDQWKFGHSFLRDENYVFSSSKFQDTPKEVIEQDKCETAKVVQKSFMTKLQSQNNPDFLLQILTRRERWKSACHILAYVRRYVNKLRERAQRNLQHKGRRNLRSNKAPPKLTIKPLPPKDSPAYKNNVCISLQERTLAELMFFRFAQQTAFAKEIFFLQNDDHDEVKDFSKLGKLKKFMPMWDSNDQLLKMNSRLRYSNLHNMPAHPIILPKDHPVTTKFVQYCHSWIGHANLETTMYIVRQRVFIENNRRTIRSILHGCSCRKMLPIRDAKMAPLPRCRIERARAFKYCSIDFCGAFFSYGRGFSGKPPDAPPRKIWGCLISCYTTRYLIAVPLIECTTDAVIHAIRRASATVNQLGTIFSDNAQNFLKAGKDMKKLLKNIDWQRVAEKHPDIEFDWLFNCPARPHSNATIERSVALFKSALKKALGTARVTEDELKTIFDECAAITNMRPLGRIHSESDGSNLPVSPSCLLKGSDNATALLPDPDDSVDKPLAEKFKNREKILNAFWSIWQKSWLQSLAVTNYWYKDSHIDLKEGMILQIADSNQLRCQHKYGVIVKLNTSQDGRIRSCDLRLADGSIITRGLNKLSCFEHDTIPMTKKKHP